MSILVTGGAGFIGSHLVRTLAQKGEGVIIADNFNQYYSPALKEARLNTFLREVNPKVYRVDMADFESLKTVFQENKIEKICHLAAQAGVRYSLQNPFVYIDSNIKGTLNILELAKDFNVPYLVYASSSSVYGGNRKLPFSEEDRTDDPISLYAASKKATELLVQSYVNMYGLKAAGFRFFTVYGPWGRPDMALFTFADKILNDKPIDIYNFGKMKRDFTFIDDIISGIVSALVRDFQHEIFNLGRSETVELEYFISVIEKKLGKQAQKNFLPLQSGDVQETYADIAKARAMLDYNPRFSVEEGIEQTLDWFQHYRHLLA